MRKLIYIIICIILGNNISYSQKIVKIGAFDFYPAIFQDTDGKVKGFYVDAFKEIEKKENLKFEYVYSTWNNGLENIKNKKIDIMVSVAYTEERALFLDYSNIPLLTVWSEVYVKQSSEIDDILGLSGKTIAIMKSDVNGKQLQILTKKLSVNCNFIEKPDFKSVFESIIANEADAGVVNNTFGAGKSIEYNLKSTGIVFNPFDIYIAVHKGRNKELLNVFNQYLHKWKHDKNSIYNVSRQKWTHKNVGVIQTVPIWLKYILIAIVGIAFTLIIFILVLRYKVKIATKNVHKSEAMFKTFMENSTAYVYIKNENLNYIYNNQKVQEIKRQTNQNGLDSASSIFDKDTVALLEEADKKILNLETAQINLIYSALINDKLRWFNDYKFLLQLPDESPKVGGVALDITQIKEIENELLIANKTVERKQKELQLKNEEYELVNEELSQTNKQLKLAIEKAEESDKLKTAFLQNLSHEIRTPLNAISGFAEFLAQADLSVEKRNNFIQIIKNSSIQLTSIVNDIITISSLETKQEKINISKVSINSILDELQEIFKQQAINKNITLSITHKLTDIQSEIFTDKTKLNQILSNLLSNALKFTQEGHIEFGYNLKNNELEFYVKDSGIGISKDMHDIIFERFRQADISVQMNYGGNGLGLSISKGFVELLGGKIWLQSELEKGSIFFFTIP